MSGASTKQPLQFVPLAIPPAFILIENETLSHILSTIRTWVDECPTSLIVKSGSPEHQVWTQYWNKKIYEPYEPTQVQYLQNVLFAIAKRIQKSNVSDEDYSKEVIGLSRWFLGDIECFDYLDGLPECPHIVNPLNKPEGGICLRWTVDANRQNPLFYQAAARGKSDIIRYYTKVLGIPADQEDTASQTPIFYAARDGNLPVIEYLIDECDANVNHLDSFKQSALFYAAKNLRKEAVTLMLDKGADALIRDIQKKTAANWTDDQSIKTIIQRAQRQQQDKLKANQKRPAPSNGKNSGAGSTKRKRFALTLSGPDHVRWDPNRGHPVLYDPDSLEQLSPSDADLKAIGLTETRIPYRTTQTIPLIPMLKELERLEERLPSLSTWARDWPLWGQFPEEIIIEEITTNNEVVTLGRLDARDKYPKVCAHLAISLAPYRAHWIAELKKAVQSLLHSDDNNWFSRPVDPIQDRCPDYNNVISTPMDFGTIKKKLSDGRYYFIDECLFDIDMVFNNCFKYNRDLSNPVFIKGKELEIQWKKLKNSRFIDTVWKNVESILIQFILELRGLEELVKYFG